MVRRNWVLGFAAGGMLAGFLLAAPASAARVYVRIEPPAPVVETIPPPPSPRHLWVGGYHRWSGRQYVWVPGHYVVRPRRFSAWVPGHWRHVHRGWYWVPGHWRR
jgi:hypothetical protein